MKTVDLCRSQMQQIFACHNPASSFGGPSARYQDAIGIHTSREPSTLGSNSCS